MNAREHLQMIIHENKYATSGTIAHESSAALRELDQLLTDLTAYLKNNHDDESWYELERRAAQAGYGER